MALHCTALHYSALNCTEFNYITLHSAQLCASQCTEKLSNALHCVVLDSAVQNQALQCNWQCSKTLNTGVFANVHQNDLDGDFVVKQSASGLLSCHKAWLLSFYYGPRAMVMVPPQEGISYHFKLINMNKHVCHGLSMVEQYLETRGLAMGLCHIGPCFK